MHSARRFRFLGSVIIACAATMTASQAAAQRAPDYPERPPAAPEQVARGQQLFKSNCSFCHGSDGRGGETGPNLVRDQGRSEERRVGKECRSRWSPDHLKKKKEKEK